MFHFTAQIVIVTRDGIGENCSETRPILYIKAVGELIDGIPDGFHISCRHEVWWTAND
jgi:hypothetical protein